MDSDDSSRMSIELSNSGRSSPYYMEIEDENLSKSFEEVDFTIFDKVATPPQTPSPEPSKQ